jgi:flagellar motor switch/type III secretory pathway protein FliN
MSAFPASLQKQNDPVRNFQMAMRISAEVKVVIGSARMEFGEIAKLGPGAIIALNRKVSEPLDIVIDDGDRTRPRVCHKR